MRTKERNFSLSLVIELTVQFLSQYFIFSLWTLGILYKNLFAYSDQPLQDQSHICFLPGTSW